LFGRGRKSEVSRVDSSKLPFDKDIELAKLQTKASNNQTSYYTLFVFCVGTGITAFLACLAYALQMYPTDSKLGSQFVWAGIFCYIVFLILSKWLGTDYTRGKAKIRQGFIDIYNHKRIDD